MLGLVRKRDGSRDEAANHYMNLPSPIIHNEVSFAHKKIFFRLLFLFKSSYFFFLIKSGDADSVFRPKQKMEDESNHIQNYFLEELKESQLPPPSALSRRRAIITSKLTTNDLDDHKLSW